MSQEHWNRAKIKQQNWTKFIYYPNGYKGSNITSQEGRDRTYAFRQWCEDNASGQWMIHVVDSTSFVCVAFADEHDAVLCRLAYEDVQLRIIPSLPFSHVSDLGYEGENAEDIPAQDFLAQIDLPATIKRKLSKHSVRYMQTDNGVLILYDEDQDVHYLFV
jgi:hypothetical protein